MADGPILIDHKELTTLLVKHHGIHEGLWGLFFRFGIKAVNMPFQVPDGSRIALLPAVVVPLLEIGLQPFAELTDLSVDAAVVNPAKPQPKTRKGSAKKKPARK